MNKDDIERLADILYRLGHVEAITGSQSESVWASQIGIEVTIAAVSGDSERLRRKADQCRSLSDEFKSSSAALRLDIIADGGDCETKWKRKRAEDLRHAEKFVHVYGLLADQIDTLAGPVEQQAA